MDYLQALNLAFEKKEGESERNGESAPPPRPSLSLDRRSKAEELSFRLFDGQSLQYGDHIVDGFYDIWGCFQKSLETMLPSKYPSLEAIIDGSVQVEELHEVLVFDRSKDEKLEKLYQQAKQEVEKHRESGALVCVEALAKLVASALGGPQAHTDLIQAYKTHSQELREAKQSVVRYVGELEIGLSRHRGLLLKALADSCDLPARLLRGDFYLGAAGSDGKNSVTVVQFNNQEWMVELVTQPGRMYQMKKGTIPRKTDEILWGQDGTPGVSVGAIHEPHEQASGSRFPTVPGRDDREEASRSDSNSSGQNNGLNWNELDGPTMDVLEQSENKDVDVEGGDQRSSTDKESHKSNVEDQLVDLTRRIALQRSRSGSAELKSSGQGWSPTAQAAADLFARQNSEPVNQSGFRNSSSSEVSQEWREWREAETGQVTFEVPDAPVGDIVHVGKYGSAPSTASGKARARVRGTDQSGRMIEFELEGVTLTSAHNLSSGAQILKQLSRQSEDVQRGRAVPTAISRYRILEPVPDQTKQIQGQGQEGPKEEPRVSANSEDDASPFREASKLGDNLRLRVSTLALKPGASSASSQDEKKGSYQKPQLRPWQQTLRQFQSSLSDQPVPEASTLSRGNAASNPTRSEGGDNNSRKPSFERESAQQHRTPNSGAQLVNNPAQAPVLQLLSNSQFDSSTQRSSLADRIRSIDEGNFSRPISHQNTQSPSVGSDISAAPHEERRLSQDSQGSGKRSSVSPRLHEQRQRDGYQAQAQERQPPQRVSSAMFAQQDEDVEVNFSEVELGPRIGIGCFGEVFKARWRQTTVAVKRLFDQSLSEQSLREFRDEVMLNRRIKHPNVILFMGACTQPPNLSIITQWAPRGSLFHLLHSTKPGRPKLALRQKLRMALDIARGMHYLHSAKPPIIHRDLKSMNLLVDNDLTIKVCDFGLARTRSSTWMTGRSQGGTPEWTAPEVLRNLNYNEKSDVYSFGVVLYELATETEPWAELTPMQVVGAVGWANQRLEPPDNCPKIFADLIRRCFLEPEMRPSFDEAIQQLLDYAPETRTGGGSEEA